MIVVVDNRDSFVFNLTRHFQLLGVETVVVPSHGTTAAAILAVSPAAIRSKTSRMITAFSSSISS